MPRFSLVFALLMVFGSLTAQEVRVFEISAAGITVGEITAIRETKDSLTYYSLDSNVSFWFFTQIDVRYSVNSVYHRDHLLSSSVTTKSSKGDFTSTVQWNNDHYDVNATAYKYTNKEMIKESIQSNSARMYFEEPVGMSTVLADGFGVLASLTYEENAYAMDVLGKVNHYHFNNGFLKRAVVYHSVKNFEVTPKKK